MAEPRSTVKGTIKKTKKDLPASRSLLHLNSTPLGNVNNTGRLSLMSNARLQRVTSTSLEKLSFISEKEEATDLENYFIEYSTYLLRKVQNRVLTINKEQKEENVKKCFVSLKWELEELLEKYVNLSKEIGYFKIYFEIIKECTKKIEDGTKLLNLLKVNEMDGLMKSLSISLDHTINRLQLVGIDKSIIKETINKKAWGPGSEIEECLKKIDSVICKDKDAISKIASEIKEIKKLSEENAILRERFQSAFEKISNEILEKNYELFTNIVKRAFNQREQNKNDFTSLSLDCDLSGFLDYGLKPLNTLSLQLSKLDSSYPVTPNSASTPQHI